MHVTITGMGRGGTSIMGQVFSRHPRVEFRHEQSALWMERALQLKSVGRLTAEQATNARKAKAREWARPKRAGALVVEKDPRHVARLAFMRALWPEAAFIYMLRDPRDLACSALKGLRKKGRTIDDWLAQRGGVIAEFLRPLRPLPRIVAWWQYCVLHDLQDMREDLDFWCVHYEDLVREPSAIVGQVFDRVGLDLHPKVQQFLPKVSDDPTVHVSHLSAGNFVAGHERRVGRWRSEWTEEDARCAWRFAGETMAALGYTED